MLKSLISKKNWRCLSTPKYTPSLHPRGKGQELIFTQNNFLLSCRTMPPHRATGTWPRELLIGHTLHTCWDLLKPSTTDQVHSYMPGRSKDVS